MTCLPDRQVYDFLPFNFLKLNRKEREYKKRKERKNTNYFARFA
jgi:hypothetical protein